MPKRHKGETKPVPVQQKRSPSDEYLACAVIARHQAGNEHSRQERIRQTNERHAEALEAIAALKRQENERWSKLEEASTLAAAAMRNRGQATGDEREPTRTCRLRIAGGVIMLDEAPVPLDMTAEARDAALCFLAHLLRTEGGWISGNEINMAERALPGEGHAGQRWDRVRKRLPEPLMRLVESSRRKGFRLLRDAWRK